MKAPFTYGESVWVVCSVADCDSREVCYATVVFAWEERRIPVVPKKWRQIGPSLFCPKHDLTLMVDGKDESEKYLR